MSLEPPILEELIETSRTVVEFFVPGKPKAKGRHRTRIVRPRQGKPFASQYTDSQTAEYENLVKLAASAAMAENGIPAPLAGPLRLEIEVRKGIPTSFSKKRREQAMNGVLRPMTKPDGSNVQKALEDGMNGIVYEDDKQIVEWEGTARYDVTSGVVVRVISLQE